MSRMNLKMNDNDEDEDGVPPEKLAAEVKVMIDQLSEQEAKLFLSKYYALKPSMQNYNDIARLSREISEFVFDKKGWSKVGFPEI